MNLDDLLKELETKEIAPATFSLGDFDNKFKEEYNKYLDELEKQLGPQELPEDYKF